MMNITMYKFVENGDFILLETLINEHLKIPVKNVMKMKATLCTGSPSYEHNWFIISYKRLQYINNTYNFTLPVSSILMGALVSVSS